MAHATNAPTATETSYALGIDVSKHKLDLLLLGPSGKQHARIVSNDPDGFEVLWNWLEDRLGAGPEKVHACLEASGGYQEKPPGFSVNRGWPSPWSTRDDFPLTPTANCGARRPIESARQAAAYAGLVPSRHESGKSVKKQSKLSKVGCARLRKALYFPAITALRCNDAIKAFGKRLEGCVMENIENLGIPHEAVRIVEEEPPKAR